MVKDQKLEDSTRNRKTEMKAGYTNNPEDRLKTHKREIGDHLHMKSLFRRPNVRGLSRKDHAKVVLLKHFEENVDFLVNFAPANSGAKYYLTLLCNLLFLDYSSKCLLNY